MIISISFDFLSRRILIFSNSFLDCEILSMQTDILHNLKNLIEHFLTYIFVNLINIFHFQYDLTNFDQQYDFEVF